MGSPSRDRRSSGPAPAGAADAARILLEGALRDALETAALRRGLLIAFSGGPDSTALLYTARRYTRRSGLSLWAFHVDHRLDADSQRRRRAAQALAEQLGVPFRAAESARSPRRGRSIEAEARRERYRLLEAERRRLDADWVLTAHHRDDQLETLLLRIRQGSGLRGLAGIQRRFRRIVRPFLDTPRDRLAESLVDLPELEPILDPTNQSMRHARNRIRHRLLPALARLEPAAASPAELAGAVARNAAGARRAVDRRLTDAVDLRRETGDDAPSLCTARLLALPPALRPWCVALLCERTGEPYPPPARAVDELLRQLDRQGRARCDWSASRRMEVSGGRLRVLAAPRRDAPREG